MICSEDIFQNILFKRKDNQKKNSARENLKKQYLQYKYNPINYESLEDLSLSVETRKKTQSKFIKSRIEENSREFSIIRQAKVMILLTATRTLQPLPPLQMIPWTRLFIPTVGMKR